MKEMRSRRRRAGHLCPCPGACGPGEARKATSTPARSAGGVAYGAGPLRGRGLLGRLGSSLPMLLTLRGTPVKQQRKRAEDEKGGARGLQSPPSIVCRCWTTICGDPRRPVEPSWSREQPWRYSVPRPFRSAAGRRPKRFPTYFHQAACFGQCQRLHQDARLIHLTPCASCIQTNRRRAVAPEAGTQAFPWATLPGQAGRRAAALPVSPQLHQPQCSL